MKGLAERRILDGIGIHGLFLVPQTRPTNAVAGSIVLIWSASRAHEWQDHIVYLPI